MTAFLNQDFVTYAGDNVGPIFLVRNSANQPVDISAATEIVWIARRNIDATPTLTKKMSLGQIAFVTTGADGKFQVNITPADTTSMSDYYEHLATLTIGGLVTTVSVGRMQVASRPEWTYVPQLARTQPLYAVRNLIGDVRIGDQLLVDDEINAALAIYSDNYLAAAECCRMIAARYARDVDVQQGELRTLYSSRRRAYQSLAQEMQNRGFARTGVQGYAGGISQTDKTNFVVDEDRVPPQFNIGMQDNYLPIGPPGNETPGAPAPEGIPFP